MNTEITSDTILWALRFIASSGPVARECALALAKTKGAFTHGSEALVGLHDARTLAGLLSKRADELQFTNHVAFRPSHKMVLVHSESRYQTFPIEVDCSIRLAQGLLAALLVAPTADVGFESIRAASNTEQHVAKDGVFFVLDKPSGLQWFGRDPLMPQPGEKWFVVDVQQDGAVIERVADRQRHTTFANFLADKAFVANV